MQSLPQEFQASIASDQGSQAEPKLPVSVGAAQSFIEGELGGPVSELDGSVSITASPTKIVDNNPEGVALVMINVGSNPCYLSPDNEPSSTHGIYLTANGGSVSMGVRDDYTLPTREWYGIAPSGNTTIYYIRLRRFTTTPPNYAD